MNETQRVLKMLEEGIITSEEASQLLDALASSASPSGSPSPPGSAQPQPKDMRRFRWLSGIPFAVALTALVLGGWGTIVLYHHGDGRMTAGFAAVLLFCLIAAAATGLALWMMIAPWLHVRIRDETGHRLAISLPVPLGLAAWGLRLAHRFVDSDTAERLDTAASLVRSTRESLRVGVKEPIVIDINAEGEHVQVYLG